MKVSEIREMSAADLQERLDAERASLAEMKMNLGISPLEDTSKLRKAKKNIAKMLTVLSQIENQDKK